MRWTCFCAVSLVLCDDHEVILRHWKKYVLGDNKRKIIIQTSEIDAEFSQMFNAATEDTTDSFDEEHVKILMGEKAKLQR